MHILRTPHPSAPYREPGPQWAIESLLCTVGSVYADHCLITVPGLTDTVRAVTAMHLPLLQPGCRVLAVRDPKMEDWLIHAAFLPAIEASPETAPAVMQFDPQTRTLRLDASRLQLHALDAIELTCGSARLKVTLQGAIQIMGDSITSSAVGSHRIEGASIDLN